MRGFFKRLKSQKGLSGVLVALLLVVVGVGLVAGVNGYLDTQKGKIEQAGSDKVDAIVAEVAPADG